MKSVDGAGLTWQQILSGRPRKYDRTARVRIAVLVAGIVLSLGGCAGSQMMESYVAAHCHTAGTPFATFAVEQENMPGFIEQVVSSAVAGALERQGLQRANVDAVGPGPDVTLVATFSMLDSAGSALRSGSTEDPFGDHLVSGEPSRFVAHVDLEMRDNRDGSIVWRGSMDRPHAIVGGETFHDDRAVLTISTTLDDMLDGVMVPCSP